MQDKVLVLMSTYNGEKYLKEQIDSVLSQKKVEVKLLVRDDGSTDSTQNILKEYENQNRLVWYTGENKKAGKSFADLLIKAHEYEDINYYAFCDQDDFWLEEKLFNAIKLLKKEDDKHQLLYCSNLFVVDKELKNKKLKYPKNYVKISLENSLAESYGTGCTMVFNKPVVDFFYLHTPNILHLHDLWIYHQCIIFGRVIYDSNSFILYRQHENNVVGANFGFKSKLKNKIKSIRTLKKQHYREIEAQEIINVYNDLLKSDDFEIIRQVAYYKKSVKCFFKLFFSLKIRRRKFMNNLFFKLRILLGVI